MGIEWLRDLVICILGIVTIIVLIFIAVLVSSLYRRSQSLIISLDLLCQRASSVLDNLETTSESMRGIISDVHKTLVSPASQIVAIVQGVRQGMNLVNKLFKKEEEKENE
jgi:predicted PurR-regulated permease PerM